MLIKENQIPYIANKIVIDLLNSNFVKFDGGLDKARKRIEEILADDVAIERELEDEVKEIIAQQEEENEYMFYDVDKKELFKMLKRKLAKEDGFLTKKEDRLNHLAHKIIEDLWDNELIDYEVSDGKMKNIVFNSMNSFIKEKYEIEDVVYDKLKNYKKPLIPGSEEWELVFTKLYEQELKKRGML
ncbi:MAG: DUF507 family protein [Epsilonproteobacteria bacterium]|nr:DUF507 family protein [Campylobacterota bacterium]